MDQEPPKYLFRPIADQATSSSAINSCHEPVMSTVMRHHAALSPTKPKLYSCWRRSEEAWSSTGSRHSSRPGSSTASSSRPPSQPNNASVLSGLYCKSNNSSLSDVSVARNFQQLSVSSRRALFKTQKWSHSFDQPALATSAQVSPGRRRQANNGHVYQNKSLDLDSGYSGSADTQSQRIASVYSPLDSVKREWEQLKWENLPSFPESFPNNPDVHLTAPADESLDDLDEEIKMIVARGERRKDSDELMSFLDDIATDQDLDDPDHHLLYVRPEPVRTRNPLLCQKSSSSSGYETCISSVSDNVDSTSSGANVQQAPQAPPRTKRGLTKAAKAMSKSPANPESPSGEFLLPSSSSSHLESANGGAKMHLEPLISFDQINPAASMVTSSPISSPILLSPPSTANTQVETRIFQFPSSTPCNQVKNEDWAFGASCIQDANAGYAPINNCSPMAISPSMSTLNTPRGSITSMRSQQSPMHTDLPVHSGGGQPDPMMTSYEAFEAAVSYTVNHHENYPSPPRSPEVACGQVTSTTTSYNPSYEDYYCQMMPNATTTFKNELVDHNLSSVMTTYASTPDPCESFVSSDTCPETPDSSVKEEADVNSPDTGSYTCLWQDCHEEFVTQKALVDHISDSHMESKKGCEEFPCLWKDCSRKSKAFNAKYKLITHMRVHTKEKPYLCMHENCNRAFARSENRKIHMRSHTGDKPFNCKYAQEFNCTKKFSNSSDRAKHEQTHKDPKPYRCEVLGCTKRYTDPSSLRKHVKSHSQEEQLQYRRSKDLANIAKRSTSPTARYSSWTPASSSASMSSLTPAGLNNDDSSSTTHQHLLTTSSSTLLQTGGTLLSIEEITASSSQGAPSPMMQQSGQKSENLSHRNESYHQILTHQQNSLDDLDNDTIPFDSVPVRYDDTGLYDHWPSNDPSSM